MEAVIISFVGTVRLQAVNSDDLILRPSPDRVRFNLKYEGVNLLYNCPRPGPIDVGFLAVTGAERRCEKPDAVSLLILVAEPSVAKTSPGNSFAYVLPSPLGGIEDAGPHGLRVFLSLLQSLVRITEEEIQGCVTIPTE